MKKITNSLRNKISQYKKNKMDIRPLIEGYSLEKEDLSGTIIKNLNRIKENLSYCNFANCIFQGDTHLSHSNISYCNFKNTVFEGKVLLRHVNAQGANFEDAYVPWVEYVGGNFKDVLFCSTIWRLGSRVGYKAKLNKKILDMWGIEIE